MSSVNQIFIDTFCKINNITQKKYSCKLIKRVRAVNAFDTATNMKPLKNLINILIVVNDGQVNLIGKLNNGPAELLNH